MKREIKVFAWSGFLFLQAYRNTVSLSVVLPPGVPALAAAEEADLGLVSGA